MVLLSAIKSLFESENLFEKGHPVQLLLHIFIQFSQESAVILLQEIETLLPAIPIESRQYIQKAQNVFSIQYQQKEYIQKEEINNDDDTKDTEQDDNINIDQQEIKNNNNNKEWMDNEKFQRCDLYFRKACKTSPKSIKCYIKHIKFLFQCNKMSSANEIYQKLINIIHNLQKSKKGKNSSSNLSSKGSFGHQVNNRTKGRFNKKATKKSKNDNNNKKSREKTLDLETLNKLETLTIFYFGYLYYMQDDNKIFDKYLNECLGREPNNIGLRCQYISCLTTSMEYEKAYIYTIETLKLIKDREKDLTQNELETMNYYRVICGIGCAAIRCIFGVDWNMISEHLKYAMEYNKEKIGIINYCYSYSLFKCGKYQQSNQYYQKFVKYINKKKEDAQKKKKETKIRNREEIDIDDNDKESQQDAAMIDAQSKLSMDNFKWHHPDYIKNKDQKNKYKLSEIFDDLFDLFVAIIIIILTYYITGYRTQIGNCIMDWFILLIMCLISCILMNPSLGILLIAVSLPPYNQNMMQFDYFAFFSKYLCVSLGLFVIYKTIIGGNINELIGRKLF